MIRLLRASDFSLVICGAFIGAAAPDLLTATVSAAPPAITCSGLPATIVGTPGDDVINGTTGPDVIAGLDGNDVIDGGQGDDVICGGPGEDTLSGSGGNDTLFGGQGNDDLHTSDFPTLGNTLYGRSGRGSTVRVVGRLGLRRQRRR
jgi:Ca2+-binding RTX toxin-like protein